MKIKPLTKNQIIISIDRLTRFKEPEIKYLRVFKEIILNNLIEPKYKKTDLDSLSYKTLREKAEEIINKSLDIICPNNYEYDDSINQKLYKYEDSIFNINKNTKNLILNKINYKKIIDILPEEIPDNLKFLKSLLITNYNSGVFPIKKILLCEGITEEILLPKFAEICGYNLSEHGIYVVSAGGKNQVVKYFYNFAEALKIPIFVLLDNDAKENLNQIKPKLRKLDKIHLIKSGEFEDLLPLSLITKTLKYETKNISLSSISEAENYSSTVEFLTEYFRHRGLHEFKKAEFAQDVKKQVSSINDVSDEIKEIFEELI